MHLALGYKSCFAIAWLEIRVDLNKVLITLIFRYEYSGLKNFIMGTKNIHILH